MGKYAKKAKESSSKKRSKKFKKTAKKVAFEPMNNIDTEYSDNVSSISSYDLKYDYNGYDTKTNNDRINRRNKRNTHNKSNKRKYKGRYIANDVKSELKNELLNVYRNNIRDIINTLPPISKHANPSDEYRRLVSNMGKEELRDKYHKHLVTTHKFVYEAKAVERNTMNTGVNVNNLKHHIEKNPPNIGERMPSESAHVSYTYNTPSNSSGSSGSGNSSSSSYSSSNNMNNMNGYFPKYRIVNGKVVPDYGTSSIQTHTNQLYRKMYGEYNSYNTQTRPQYTRTFHY